MSLIKAVLWDMDGTLIDSEAFYFQAWKKVLEKYGLYFEKNSWLREMAGKTTQQVYVDLVSNYQLNAKWEVFFHQIKEEVAFQYTQDPISLMPYAIEALTDLQAKGVQLGLVTSSYRRVVEIHLKSLQVYDYFDFFITKDDVKNPKPNPEPYNLAIEKLNGVTLNEILVFEDSATGVTSAVNAGLKCVGIHSDVLIKEKLPTPHQYANLEELFKSAEFLAPIF